MKRYLDYINLSFPIILIIIALLYGCDSKDNNVTEPVPEDGIYFGESGKMGDGNVLTWIQLTPNGEPQNIGISFDEEALTNLPDEDFMLELDFPSQNSNTAFNHVEIDWNHMGHEPDGIYTLPHFDFHFYMIDKNLQKTIPGGPDPISVDSNEIAPDYISTVDAVPQMGVHYIDVTSPELHGQPFTETFLYGYYFGNMIFVEPMITLEYLKSKPSMTKELKVPKVYPYNGDYYPRNYSIVYDSENKLYNIILGEFAKN